MKKLYTICYSMILLSIVLSAIFLMLAPDIVPVHYNFAGEVDRFGSKYEHLIWPLFTVAMGVFFILFARTYGKKGDTTNEKALLYVGICTLVFFAALGCYFMIKAIRYESGAPAIDADIIKFVGITIGVMLVIFGILMPKAHRNSMFGLRTKWSMANDSVWVKSQRFGAISAIICGSLMIILSLHVPGMWNMLTMTLIAIVWTSSCAIASYYFYKNDKNE